MKTRPTKDDRENAAEADTADTMARVRQLVVGDELVGMSTRVEKLTASVADRLTDLRKQLSEQVDSSAASLRADAATLKREIVRLNELLATERAQAADRHEQLARQLADQATRQMDYAARLDELCGELSTRVNAQQREHDQRAASIEAEMTSVLQAQKAAVAAQRVVLEQQRTELKSWGAELSADLASRLERVELIANRKVDREALTAVIEGALRRLTTGNA